ncbi:MAG: stalk domain-containing protein, partial [Bacteroidota bacterium]
EPKAISFNNQIYIAPRALVNYFGFEVFFNDETQTFSIKTEERTIEIAKNEPNFVSIDGLAKISLPLAPIVFEDELYFPLHIFRSLLNLNFTYDSKEQIISLS